MQLTNNHSNQGAFFAIHLNQILKCTATVSTSFYFTLKTLKRGFNHTCQKKIIILEGSLIVGVQYYTLFRGSYPHITLLRSTHLVFVCINWQIVTKINQIYLTYILSLFSLQTQVLQIIEQIWAFPGDIHNRGLDSSLTLRPCLLKTRPIQNELKKSPGNYICQFNCFYGDFSWIFKMAAKN